MVVSTTTAFLLAPMKLVFPVIIHVKEVLDRGPLMSELPSAYLPGEGVDLSRIHVFDTWRGKVDGSGPGDNGMA